MSGRPRVVLLRGHHASVWDLRPWELLRADFEVAVLVTGSNLHQVEGLDLELVAARTPRDKLPAGRAAGGLAYALGERYLGLEKHLAGADVVHCAELGTWYSAQAARLKRRLGFSLVVTVWETIPWLSTYRWPRERRYRRAVLDAADLFMPTTERASRTLELEGVAAERMEHCPPGIDLTRFSRVQAPERGRHRILSAGRLVWEKGHQDVLRAVAALRDGLVGLGRDDLELAIVGSGPEESRLRAHAAELGLGSAVEFRATVPYDEMPAFYASASALVLASLPTKGWEEQFGMVLVEALACGTPVVAAASGAIPEVVGSDATLFSPGDWLGLARALHEGPLSHPPGARTRTPPDRLAAYSMSAASERYRAAYGSVLARSDSARS